MKTCSFEGCDRKYDCNGLCKTHNKQMYDCKNLTAVKDVTLTMDERFISKIDKSGECWVWTANKSNGYGRFDTTTNSKAYAHRYAYELWVGPIPEGAVVHHKCGNRPCCNPDHLQLTTQIDNLAEMFARKAYEARIAELEARVAELEAQVQKAGAN